MSFEKRIESFKAKQQQRLECMFEWPCRDNKTGNWGEWNVVPHIYVNVPLPSHCEDVTVVRSL